MSRSVIVRYRVKPDAVDENVELVRAVYEELAATQPDGIRYSTYRVDDRTFVHVAVIEGAENPLDALVAFRAFSASISERCEEDPEAVRGEIVGSYASS